MGRPRPRVEAPSPALSPARQALADHLEHLLSSRPKPTASPSQSSDCREQLAVAMIDLQNAELVLANIDKAHSAEIAKAARENCCSVEPVESAEAEASVQRARRNVNSIRMALEEVQSGPNPGECQSRSGEDPVRPVGARRFGRRARDVPGTVGLRRVTRTTSLRSNCLASTRRLASTVVTWKRRLRVLVFHGCSDLKHCARPGISPMDISSVAARARLARHLVDGAPLSVTSRAIPVRPDDNTPLSELRRNVVAVGLGAFATVALLDWIN